VTFATVTGDSASKHYKMWTRVDRVFYA
jgi:hypothetical protein